MASPILNLLSVTLLFLTLFNAVNAVQEDELQTMLAVLRARGHNLFSNAIATSDLNYDVVSGDSFTFFAPTDSSLFTLDMSDTASDYTNTLRCHVIPRRLSMAELRRFPSGSFFATLMKERQVQVKRRRGLFGADVLTVDGVDVVFPGLFYGSDVAVHGLGGILNLTGGGQVMSPPHRPAVHRLRHHPRSPVNATETVSKVPRSPRANLSANHGVGSPIASQSQPLPSPANFSDHSPLVNSSTNHSIGSPLANQVHDHTPPANISSPGSPGNSSVNHTIAPAVMNQTLAPPPLANISDLLEPPSYNDIENRTIESLLPAPAFFDGFSPAHPPQLDHSPAHDSWYKVPISPAFFPRTASPAPAPEFSENDDPMSFMQSFGGFHDGEEQNISVFGTDDDKNLKTEPYGDFSAISPEDLAGIMEMVPEYLDPLEQRIFDCWLFEELAHVSIQHGYLYTRQQTPTSTPSLSCARI